MNRKTVRFIAVTILGLALAQYGSDLAYHRRGYYAIGGEIFILPCVYLIAYGLPHMIRGLTEIINSDWNDFEDLEDEEDENGTEQEEISTSEENGSQGAVKLHRQTKTRGTRRSA